MISIEEKLRRESESADYLEKDLVRELLTYNDETSEEACVRLKSALNLAFQRLPYGFALLMMDNI